MVLNDGERALTVGDIIDPPQLGRQDDDVHRKTIDQVLI